jgi:hypothetical protein
MTVAAVRFPVAVGGSKTELGSLSSSSSSEAMICCLELKNKKVETSQKIWPFRTAPVGCTVFVIGRHWALVVNCRRRWFPRRHHQASSSVVIVLNQTIIVKVIVVDIKRAAIFGSPSKRQKIDCSAGPLGLRQAEPAA